MEFTRLGEFNIHLVGDESPTTKTLEPYQQAIKDIQAEQPGVVSIENGLDNGETFDFFQRNPKGSNTKPSNRAHYWFKNDVDVINPDGIASEDELVLYGYRVDQLGNKDGAVSADEAFHAFAISMKNYLYTEAQRLGFPEESLEQIEKRLREDTFAVAGRKFADSLNVMNQKTEGITQDIKATAAARNYDNTEKLGNNLEEGEILPFEMYEMKRLLLNVFAQKNVMPSVSSYLKGIFKKERVFNLISSWVNIVDPGVKQRGVDVDKIRVFYDQVPIYREENGLNVTFNDQFYNFGHHTGDNDSFCLELLAHNEETYLMSPEGIQPELDMLTEVLIKRLNEDDLDSFKALYDNLDQAISNPALLQKLLVPIYKTILECWWMTNKDFQTPTFEVMDSRDTQLLGQYSSSKNLISVNRIAFLEKYKLLGKDVLFKEMVNTLIHEVFHGYQYIMVDQRRNIPFIGQSSELDKRFRDWAVDTDLINKNTGNISIGNKLLTSTILTGSGEAFYKNTALEIDAFYIGDKASEGIMEKLINSKKVTG